MEALGGLLIALGLLMVSFVVGKSIDAAHLRSLEKREFEFKDILVTNLKTIPPQAANAAAVIVTGEAVIATDYFKVFVAGLVNLFGGEIKAFVILQNRARREATLRMLANARHHGAKAVWNIRYETAMIQGQEEKKSGGVEVIAYGTALVW